MYAQVLANAILLGGLYSVVALGFSLVWGVMGIINVSHGSLIMIGAYVTFFLHKGLNLDPFLLIPAAMAILFVIGYAMQFAIINRILGAGLVLTLMVTFGLDMLMTNGAILLWSPDYRAATPTYSGANIAIGSVIIPIVRLLIFLVAFLLVGLLYAYLTWTRGGRAIRALALQPEAAQLVGVSQKRTFGWAMGIGAAMAGGAGALIATTFPVYPFMGPGYLLKAFVITVLGGMGDMAGAIVGALVLALAETFGAKWIGAGYQEAIGLILLVVVLAVRPRGLLGKRFYGEAE